MKIKYSVLITQSLILCGALLSTQPSSAAVQFNEVSTALGINLADDTTNTGFGWIDYDNDGDMDLIIPTSASLHLYKNMLKESGAAGFNEVLFTNSTFSGNFRTVFVADYDGNGCDDVLSGDKIFRNNTCDINFSEAAVETFSDVTSAIFEGLPPQSITAAAFGDVDNDGDLDLYIAYQSAQKANELYINTAGIYSKRQINDTGDIGGAWATAFTDYDNDGDLDIFVANDTYICDLFDATCSAQPSQIYKNTKSETGVLGFEPVGLGIHIAAMGLAIGDYNNDGNLDYYQTDIGHGALTTGNGTNLLNLSDTIKLVNPADINDNRAGWGTAFFDANNDGYVDLFRANSNVAGVNTTGISNDLFLNNGDSTFNEVAASVGLKGLDGRGSGLAYVDFDNDGLIDTITGRNSGVYLHKNNSTIQNWIKINLKGNNPNHRGIGAKIFIRSSSSNNATPVKNQMREIHAGSSFQSANEYRAHFGLGTDDTINRALVVWPSGCRQLINVSGLNQIIDVPEWQCGLANGVAGNINTGSTTLESANITALDPWSGVTLGTATSDTNGRYNLAIEVCICEMSASKIGWSISWDNKGPGGQNWAWVNNNLVIGDFTATRTSGTISGFAIGPNSNPVAAVTITASNQNGSISVVATTDANGHYEIEVPDDTYWVQSLDSIAGCSSFAPEGTSFINSLVNVNFDDNQKNVICKP